MCLIQYNGIDCPSCCISCTPYTLHISVWPSHTQLLPVAGLCVIFKPQVSGKSSGFQYTIFKIKFGIFSKATNAIIVTTGCLTLYTNEMGLGERDDSGKKQNKDNTSFDCTKSYN